MSHMDPSLAAIAEDNCVDVVCLGKPQVVMPDVVDQIGRNIRALSFHEAAFAFLEIPQYRSDLSPLSHVALRVLRWCYGRLLLESANSYERIEKGAAGKLGPAVSAELRRNMLPAPERWLDDVLVSPFDEAHVSGVLKLQGLRAATQALMPLEPARPRLQLLVAAIDRVLERHSEAHLVESNGSELAQMIADAVTDDEAIQWPELRGFEFEFMLAVANAARCVDELNALMGADLTLPDIIVSSMRSISYNKTKPDSPVCDPLEYLPEGLGRYIGGVTFLEIKDKLKVLPWAKSPDGSIASYVREAIRGGHLAELRSWVAAIITLQGYLAVRAESFPSAGPDYKNYVESMRVVLTPQVDISSIVGASSSKASDAIDELEGMTGLGSIKQQVKALATELQVAQERRARGLPVPNVSRHMVFEGNPGTAKTTVARLIGRIFKQVGLLRSGKVVEVSRQDLVSQYVGHTAKVTQEKVDEALGGVLFIDEAYTLAPKSPGSSDFGTEAIETLMKAMEDHRDDLIVIVAGYHDEMQNFFRTNPGLASRFPTTLTFDDYSDDELVEIFLGIVESMGLKPVEGVAAAVRSQIPSPRPKGYGNGRAMRTLAEFAYKRQNLRLANSESLESADTDVSELLPVDISDATDESRQESRPGGSQGSAMKELQGMTGLAPVKEQVRRIVAKATLAEAAAEAGVVAAPESRHMLFLGNPGTAKTTVARLIARIYKDLGVLREGHLVEVKREDLVAGYVGQTAEKTIRAAERALGGVLFIDEAYTLARQPGSNDFGGEAIDALLAFMEDHRDDLVVIAAGYTKEMQTFLEANSGIPSRFPVHVHFPDYTDDELVSIFSSMVKVRNMVMGEGVEAAVRRFLPSPRPDGFGNARYVRNLFEQAVGNQQLRLFEGNDLSPEAVRTMLAVDLPR